MNIRELAKYCNVNAVYITFLFNKYKYEHTIAYHTRKPSKDFSIELANEIKANIDSGSYDIDYVEYCMFIRTKNKPYVDNYLAKQKLIRKHKRDIRQELKSKELELKRIDVRQYIKKPIEEDYENWNYWVLIQHKLLDNGLFKVMFKDCPDCNLHVTTAEAHELTEIYNKQLKTQTTWNNQN